MSFKYPGIFDVWLRLASKICHYRKTGQTTSYVNYDDGHYEAGVDPDWEVLDSGQFAGTCAIVINGKTHNLSNNCVRDKLSVFPEPIMFARYVPDADIGPATDGKLFWQQYTITGESITFDQATKTITAAAGTPFDTGALCVGRKFLPSGTANNNTELTVAANAAGDVITTEEALVDEGPVATDFATVDDLVWDFVDQANANSLGGYTDWRLANVIELESLLDYESINPSIDTTAFPSTPTAAHWVSTTYKTTTTSAWRIGFHTSSKVQADKKTSKNYCRLVRGGV